MFLLKKEKNDVARVILNSISIAFEIFISIAFRNNANFESNEKQK